MIEIKIRNKARARIDIWSQEYGILTDVVVFKGHRGKGYGNQLMEILINKCKEKGIKYLCLTVRKDNIIAKRLYEKFGFRITDRMIDLCLDFYERILL